MKKIAFIAHGKYKNHTQFTRDLNDTFGSEFQLSFLFTEKPFHSIELTEKAIQNGAEIIICCGGDGSLNECANGIMNQSANQNVLLGALPMGTGNDFIKSLDAPKEMRGLKSLIERNQFKHIDLGFAHFNDFNEKSVSRFFINITDIGMGGVVAEKLSRSSKILGSYLTYQMSIVSSLASYKKQPIKVAADTFQYQGQVMNFVVANGKWFGSGLGIAPDADPCDGMLNVVVLGDLGFKEYLKYQPSVRKCKKINHPEIKYYQAKHISIDSDQKLPIDMDGEFVGYSPLQIEIKAGAIRFLA